MSISINTLRDNLKIREQLLDQLCIGIKDVSNFRDSCEYIIDNKSYLFKADYVLYNDEENISELILPLFRRVWSKVYQDPPTLFTGKRLELFQLLFNIDEFIEYLLETLSETKGALDNFKNIDKNVEHLTLISNDYISLLVNKMINFKDIELEIREVKIKKLIK